MPLLVADFFTSLALTLALGPLPHLTQLADYPRPIEEKHSGRPEPALSTERGKLLSPDNTAAINEPTVSHNPTPQEKGWGETLVTNPQDTFAMVLAVFTAVLIGVGIWQSVQMRSQVGQAANQVRKLRQTIRTMRDTERRQLRAYVGVDTLEFLLPDLSDPDYRRADHTPGYVHKNFVRVTFRNFGQTPAYEVAIHVNWEPTPYPQRLPHDFSYADHGILGQDDPGPTVSRQTLHADQHRTSIVAIFDVSPFRTTNAQETSLYLYGHIDYLDIYLRKWQTNFCYAWEPWAPAGLEFIPYRAHNDEVGPRER